MTDQPQHPPGPDLPSRPDLSPGLSKIVIATGNPHKVEELRRLLALPGIEFVGLKDLPDHEALIEPEETGSTFEANATIKAISYAAQTGLPCLADDSGLEVDALGSAPGVISSHYCTDGRETGMTRAQRDEANNEKLLRELDAVPSEQRAARFVCVMVLASRGTGFQPVMPCCGTGFQPVPARPTPASMSPINQHTPGPLHKSLGDLPHWHQNGATYFITTRVRTGSLSPNERTIVLDACLHWHRQRALVHLAVVMPDHVHLLLSPLPGADGQWYKLPDLMHSIKSFTANTINKARETQATLWQPEYYDRIVRDGDEFQEIWEYMLKNPVTAKLVEHWMDYRWTRGGQQEQHRLEAGPTTLAKEHRLEAGPTVLATSRGTFDGRIGTPGAPPAGVPRGTNGFGYDPLFLAGPECLRTGAELSAEEKNRRSHRGVAAKIMLEQLRNLMEK